MGGGWDSSFIYSLGMKQNEHEDLCPGEEDAMPLEDILIKLLKVIIKIQILNLY